MFFLSLTTVLSFSFTISCNVISNYSKTIYIDDVIDGDTFISQKDKYRILGIDTPETYNFSNNQFVPSSGPQFFYGSVAKNKAKQLLKNKNVEIESIKNDKYERKITKVELENGIDFSSYMVKNGYAIVRYISSNKSNPFYYYDYNYVDNLYKLQDEAIQNKVGFWSEPIEILKKIYPK